MNTDISLSFEELLCNCDNDRQWLLSLIEEEIILVDGQPETATFSGLQLARIRKARRISRDFEAGVPALALIMRLLDEVDELRKFHPTVHIISEQ
ncbi:chaperone modulator CbpM [Suttonella ornithocola]|uniref:MerR family transcriptional regulator n=1 Tax=Suttonella ornithocola TaxID=279832 RepID=A0A380MUB3_9GAMM|nr:chaperone modulator CbpM [Suttonella ornithocola]SUO95513.1 Uncharacterised protein [Suttonella ornithocola]